MVSTIVNYQGLRDNPPMALTWDSVTSRLATRGSDGKLLSAITGEETDAELRALIMRLTRACPVGDQHSGCPFRALQSIYQVSLQTWVNGMTRKGLLSLFELECEVRNAAAASSCLLDRGKLTMDPDSSPRPSPP